MKFGLSYQMMMTGRSGNQHYVNFPITIDFNSKHRFFASANVLDITVHSLSKQRRDDMYIDSWLKNIFYPLSLNAGYASQQASPTVMPPQAANASGQTTTLPVIFSGFIETAYAERMGPDIVTRINAVDNGNVTSHVASATFNPGFRITKGTPFVQAVQMVMGQLSGNLVSVGPVVVTPPQPSPFPYKDYVGVGSVWDELVQLTPKNAQVFIENGVCSMLGQNDTIPGTNILGQLSSSTGLLDIPRYEGYTVSCSCVFEPSFRIGAQIQLASEYNPVSDSPYYKVIEYTHHGTISGGVASTVTTDVTLLSTVAPPGAGY